MHTELEDYFFGQITGTWAMDCCDKCGVGFLNPRLTEEALGAAYASYYTHSQAARFAPTRRSWMRVAARMLADGYRKKRFGPGVTPEWPLGYWVIKALPQIAKKLDRDLRYLPKKQSGGRLLDVGFGGGRFMRKARQIGWSVCGVDIDPIVLQNARAEGLEVREGGVEAYKDQPSSFDAITMSHVIEHMGDPRGAVEEAYRLLRPGGLIYIDTPNVDATGHAIYGKYWRGLEVPRHLVIFNWRSLEGLLDDAGFTGFDRIVQNDVYAMLSRQSRRILVNRESLGFARRLYFELSVLKRRWSERKDFRKSEFILVMARKPNVMGA